MNQENRQLLSKNGSRCLRGSFWFKGFAFILQFSVELPLYLAFLGSVDLSTKNGQRFFLNFHLYHTSGLGLVFL